MHILVSTCAKYHHMLPGLFRQFRKYYGPDEVHLVTDTAIPDRSACGKLVQHCLPGQQWAAMVNQVVNSYLTEPVLLMFDDYWLTQQVQRPMVDVLALMVAQGQADKGDLGLTTSIYEHTRHPALPMALSKPNAQYRQTLQPAIWHPQALLELTRYPQMNPWQAETQSTYLPNIRNLQWTTHERVMDYANILLKGSYNLDQVCQLAWTDLQELRTNNMLPGVPELTEIQYCQHRTSGSHVFKGT